MFLKKHTVNIIINILRRAFPWHSDQELIDLIEKLVQDEVGRRKMRAVMQRKRGYREEAKTELKTLEPDLTEMPNLPKFELGAKVRIDPKIISYGNNRAWNKDFTFNIAGSLGKLNKTIDNYDTHERHWGVRLDKPVHNIETVCIPEAYLLLLLDSEIYDKPLKTLDLPHCKCQATIRKGSQELFPGDEVYITDKLREFIYKKDWDNRMLAYIGYRYILECHGQLSADQLFWKLQDDPNEFEFPESCIRKISTDEVEND